MDMPPPNEIKCVQQIQNNDLFADTIEKKLQEANYDLALRWIDGEDIPDNVKQFAKNNNCIQVMKSYYWSDKKYKGGSVYTCGINGELRYVLEYNNKIRFANWLEFKRLHKTIYE